MFFLINHKLKNMKSSFQRNLFFKTPNNNSSINEISYKINSNLNLRYNKSFSNKKISEKQLFEKLLLKRTNSNNRIYERPKYENLKFSYKILNFNKVKVKNKIFRDNLCQYSKNLSCLNNKNIELIKLNRKKEKYDKIINDLYYPLIRDDYEERKKISINQNDDEYKKKLNNSTIKVISRMKRGIFNNEYIKSFFK